MEKDDKGLEQARPDLHSPLSLRKLARCNIRARYEILSSSTGVVEVGVVEVFSG